MIVPAWYPMVAFLTAALAGGLACLLFVRRKASSSYPSLAALFGAIALTHIAQGSGVLDDAQALFWQRLALATELVQPAALLYAGIAFFHPAEGGKDASALWRTRIVAVLGLLLALLTLTDQVLERRAFDDGTSAIALASWGYVPYLFLVVTMAVGLAQLEMVLRASHEPVRYRLKFIVIGLGGLAGYQIYQAGQMLLVPIWLPEYVLVSSLATAIALSLIAYGLARSRLREVLVNAYVSQQALLGSVSFILIGLYLIAVGAIGEWLRQTDQSLGVGLSVIVVFGALVGLAIAVFSKTLRAEIRGFLSRNFYRSKYDYRAQWLQVTDAFQQAASKDAIMDRLLDLLIKTFSTTTIAIWAFRDADRRFSQIRPVMAETEPFLLDLTHPVIAELSKKDEPVIIKGGRNGEGTGTDALDDPLARSGTVLCFPIRTEGRLSAFVALGQQPHGEDYGTEDCDLLRGISHHVGALLSNARWAEERQASAELEALHRFSVFCLHDLKNLASRLSLVAQNAQHHGRDPAFQESAMRTVTDTAQKMTALLSKLSLASFNSPCAGTPEAVELFALVEEIVAPLRGEGMVRLHVAGEAVQPVMAVREQIQQVLLNVVLNAKQAIGHEGDISIAIEQLSAAVVIMVEDTGCGIPSGMLETLFQPSQSSRPGGLGIGLYQCKQIVEAHQGTIQIRSQVGKGTQVRIEFPLSRPFGDREKAFITH
ncbi:XrtA/PEP-CTERM system histidine kinase PrsK [Nitrospira sp. NS4]|uniref:XrtA/PEP-CTERM system histidine kinase PrsK n=1 Tax=Nitrospira sp. NS4 TaxID=3414498 RepID=UPI003C2F25B1